MDWDNDRHKKQYGRLERDLRSETYTDLLQQLTNAEPFFGQFKTWGSVLEFMRKGSSEDPRKDEVLRPIFQAHREDQDPRWRTVLLAIFWPGLSSLRRRKRYWDLDQGELWQTVTWSFLRVICRIDPERRPHRLVQKVMNDTFHRLHEEYRREWDRRDWEVGVEPETLVDLAGEVEDIDYAGIELRLRQTAEIRRLQEHLEKGRICETDFLLLVGTRVYGRSVADYARETGLDYQVAKKRRQRAEAVIRRHEQGG